MAKRKVKKKVVKKSSVIKNVQQGSTKSRMKLAVRNLVFFVLLSLLSFLLWNISTDPTYVNFFLLLTIIFTAISLAFLIVLVVFALIKGFRKN